MGTLSLSVGRRDRLCGLDPVRSELPTRRAWVWIQRDADRAARKDAFYQMKLNHAEINTD